MTKKPFFDPLDPLAYLFGESMKHLDEAERNLAKAKESLKRVGGKK